LDLVAFAAGKDKEVLFRGESIRLKRGQILLSERFLAERWGWSRERVRRFLEICFRSDMIRDHRRDHRISVVSVVNYELYNPSKTTDKTTKQTTDETTGETTDETTSNKGKKGKKGNKRKYSTIFPEWIPTEEFEEYKKMRVRIKKQMTDRAVQLAIKELEKLRAEGYDPKEVLEQSIFNSWQGLFPIKEQQKKFDLDKWAREE